MNGDELLVDVREAARRLHLSRTDIFALIRSGEIESLLIGERKRRIPVDALAHYVARLRVQQGVASEVEDSGALAGVARGCRPPELSQAKARAARRMITRR